MRNATEKAGCLTLREAAVFLSVGVARVRLLIRRGELKASDLGDGRRCERVEMDEVKRFLRARRIVPAGRKKHEALRPEVSQWID